MVGGIITYKNFNYPVNISFDKFCKSIATHTGTLPEQLTIAYWFRYNPNVKYQCHPTLYMDLRDEAGFRKVIDHMVQKLSVAQTRSIVLEIYNKVYMKGFTMFTQC